MFKGIFTSIMARHSGSTAEDQFSTLSTGVRAEITKDLAPTPVASTGTMAIGKVVDRFDLGHTETRFGTLVGTLRSAGDGK